MTVTSAGLEERSSRSIVLCVGIAVQDYIFRVDRFPTASTKAVLTDFVITGGGCAANAAIAIVRLGGRSRFVGPIGDDQSSDFIVDGLAHSGVDVAAITRVKGAVASLSGIFIDAAGERLLATRREQGLAEAQAQDPDRLVRDVAVVLADNHFRDFVMPICQAACHRGIPIVLDIDKPTEPADPLFALASHTIFSAEALRATSGVDVLEKALDQTSHTCRDFVAVTDGANGVFWRRGASGGHVPAFAVKAIDTLAAGDVFHGAFALALAEGRGEIEGMRLACAAAALKCEGFGGIANTPNRAEVDRLMHDD
jgi:sulfofructose kinase